MKPDKLIKVQQVADMTGLSPKTILAGRAGTSEFTRVKVGKRSVAFSFNEVQGWIDRLLKEAKEHKSQQGEQRRNAQKGISSTGRAPSREERERVLQAYRRG